METSPAPADAQSYIDRLRSSAADYHTAAAREAKVWGSVFTDPRRAERMTADQASARELGVGSDLLSLPKLVRAHGLAPQDGLSLACGEGRAERGLLKGGICRRFHGIDVSAAAVANARQLAKAENLSITYEDADLNTIVLQKHQYDLVVTQNCLHHVLELEYLADQILASLRPGGVLWIHDYVGETQFQYSDDRIAICNELLSTLPDSMRRDVVNERDLKPIRRRPVGKLVSPFEAIRSGEILTVFLARFDVIESHYFSAVQHLICPPGVHQSYCASEEGRALFRILRKVDRLLIDRRVLPPAGAQLLLRKRND